MLEGFVCFVGGEGLCSFYFVFWFRVEWETKKAMSRNLQVIWSLSPKTPFFKCFLGALFFFFVFLIFILLLFLFLSPFQSVIFFLPHHYFSWFLFSFSLFLSSFVFFFFSGFWTWLFSDPFFKAPFSLYILSRFLVLFSSFLVFVSCFCCFWNPFFWFKLGVAGSYSRAPRCGSGPKCALEGPPLPPPIALEDPSLEPQRLPLPLPPNAPEEGGPDWRGGGTCFWLGKCWNLSGHVALIGEMLLMILGEGKPCMWPCMCLKSVHAHA